LQISLWGLCLSLVVAGTLFAEPNLTAVQIAERARDQDQENFKKYGSVQCRLVETKEELNEQGVVEEREQKIHKVAAADLPVPGGRETARISPDLHKEKPDDDTSVLDRLHLFEWRLEAEDESQGEACYRLAFQPKKGARPSTVREHIISQTRGRCWVAKRDFSKIRLDGRLTRAVELAGFLVTVQEMEFLSTSKRISHQIAAPMQVRYRFRVEVFPFFEFHERHTQHFEFAAEPPLPKKRPGQKGGVAGLN